MKELKYFNICSHLQEVDSKISDFLHLHSNKFHIHSDKNELIELINSKNIHLVISRYDYEFFKNIRDLNKKIKIVAVLDEINHTHLLESLELKDIKLIVELNCLNQFSEYLKECIKAIDANKSNIVELKNDFTFDTFNKVLFKNSNVISLTKKEIEFLGYLIQNSSRALSYNELNEKVWDGTMTQDALRSLIKELRKKTYKELIKNISGIGYRIDL